MADVRVDRPIPISPVGVPGTSEERRREGGGGSGQQQPEQRPGGREELAVALGESGRSLRAELEQDADGQLLVRVVDRNRGEVVAVLSPDELRALAEQTGLPSGLLFQARS
ncbi:MAG: hypothetical protein KC461_01030 [Dehalococcoidia bacterium]|nr:hypothetical protein [Dehalococcoidia bacterium]MCA9849212.1 hypothetical protein [Dehalococcoidia bacterium]MCA9855982.1 hypothetical protein [Dehalococcoidia bacterium]MCB9483253.1 hypothetical protein [Dehalococcoidia bacterium]MCB9492298.1 hypothetical protein [Dehalococcoidia bacterium]